MSITMTSTTLMTFLIQVPPSTVTVELLGSWDNFRKPYPLQKDVRTGRGHWRGCHSFKNIICDGDYVHPLASRDGGLKMGGKYWYYYRLNGYIEYHNLAEPSTTSCPLLPGQRVNLLEVPTQSSTYDRGRSVSTSSVDSATYTMNPEDKYLTPRPPSLHEPLRTTTSVPSVPAIGREASPRTSKLAGFLDLKRNSNKIPVNIASRSLLPSHRETVGRLRRSGSRGSSSERTSLWATFHQLRGIQSAGAGQYVKSRCQDFLFARPTSQADAQNGSARRAHRETLPNPSTPIIPIDATDLNILPGLPADVAEDLVSQNASTDCPPVAFSLKRSEQPQSQYAVHENDSTPKGHHHRLSTESESSCYFTPLDHHQEHFSYFTELALLPKQSSLVPTVVDVQKPNNSINHEDQQRVDSVRPVLHRLETTSISSGVKTETKFDPPNNEILDCTSYLTNSGSSSYITNHVFSPSLSSATAYTGSISPSHLSQPKTPSTSDCGESSPGDVPARTLPIGYGRTRRDSVIVGSSRFEGYNLPEAEQASALTLRQLPSAVMMQADGESSYEQKSGKDLVQSWNDGSEHRVTALEDIFEDLSYLGTAIL